LDATVFPAQRIVVATSGGDYTSISAALAAITPSAVNPYVIEVMPGTYTDNVTMKSYVHLRGAGREVTTVQSTSSTLDVISIATLTNVAISGLTVTGGRDGIKTTNSSSVTITGNRVTTNQNMGISTTASTSVTINDNIVSGNVWHGIHSNTSAPLITGNTVSNNVINGVNNEVSGNPTVIGNAITGNGNVGVNNISSSPIISGNTITGNTDSGIANFSSSSPTITNNKITDHTGFDIRIDASSSANISFNIYDDISDNGGGVGQYNVHSSGAANPAP
jgi:parallel beta-helix repeat protein